MTVGLANTGVTTQAGSGVGFGLNSAFKGTYDQEITSWRAYLDLVMDTIPSNTLIENYYYRKSRPYPKRWPRGATRGTKGFDTIRWSTINKDWEDGVGWHRNDITDDYARSLETDIRATASRWATLAMRIRAQIMEGATDADLLDSIPNCPDGADLYNATDGAGANRFGVSGGNIISGSGVATAEQIRKDLFAARTRFLKFKDTENQPLVDAGIINQGVVIEYPAELDQVMNEAFRNEIAAATISSTGTHAASSSVVGIAGVSNVFKAMGLNIRFYANQWLTDVNDWHVHLIGAPVKPIYRQILQGVESRILTMETGDAHAIETKEERIFWDAREGYGTNLPAWTLLVSNS